MINRKLQLFVLQNAGMYQNFIIHKIVKNKKIYIFRQESSPSTHRLIRYTSKSAQAFVILVVSSWSDRHHRVPLFCSSSSSLTAIVVWYGEIPVWPAGRARSDYAARSGWVSFCVTLNSLWSFHVCDFSFVCLSRPGQKDGIFMLHRTLGPVGVWWTFFTLALWGWQKAGNFWEKHQLSKYSARKSGFWYRNDDATFKFRITVKWRKCLFCSENCKQKVLPGLAC